METTMRKIVLIGFTSLVLVCGAFGADARSSDEEDAPQAAAQAAHAPPFYPAPAEAGLRAERKALTGFRRAAAAQAQANDSQGY
jgi:hypothetical protein